MWPALCLGKSGWLLFKLWEKFWNPKKYSPVSINCYLSATYWFISLFFLFSFIGNNGFQISQKSFINKKTHLNILWCDLDNITYQSYNQFLLSMFSLKFSLFNKIKKILVSLKKNILLPWLYLLTVHPSIKIRSY